MAFSLTVFLGCKKPAPSFQNRVDAAYSRCVEKELLEIESAGGPITGEPGEQMMEVSEKAAKTFCLKVKQRCPVPKKPKKRWSPAPQCLAVLKEFESPPAANK